MSNATVPTFTITTSNTTTTTSVVTTSLVQPNTSMAVGVGTQSATVALSSTTSTCTAAAIADAFDIFDHSGNRTIDVRELGTVLRYLGKMVDIHYYIILKSGREIQKREREREIIKERLTDNWYNSEN